MDARQPSPSERPAALDNLLARIAQRIGTPEATLEQLCRASAAEALEWVAPKLAPWDTNLPTLIREWADQIEAGTLNPTNHDSRPDPETGLNATETR